MSVLRQFVTAFLAACLLALKVHSSRLRTSISHVDLGKSKSEDEHVDLISSITGTRVSTAFQKALDAALDVALGDAGPLPHNQTLYTLAKQGADIVDLEAAMKGLTLPPEVTKLVSGKNREQKIMHSKKSKAVSSSGLALDPDAVDKAVSKLNDMVLKAQTKMDEKFVECWEFHDRNRGTYRQVLTDLQRLGATLSDEERMVLESEGEIFSLDENTQQVEEELLREQKLFTNTYAIDQQDLQIKKNDLEVAEFMLGVVKCKAPSFTQVGHQSSMMTYEVKSCVDGKIDFSDPRLKNSTQQLSAPALHMLQAALNRAPLDDGGVDAAEAIAEASGAIINDDYDDGDDEPAQPLSLLQQSPGKALAPLTAPPVTVAPAKSPPANKVQHKCASAKPNCAVLHDIFASLMGEMKDLVEAKQEQLDHDIAHWKKEKTNFNSQLSMQSLQMGQAQTILAEATSAKSGETDEQTQKLFQKNALQKEYTSVIHMCKKRKLYIFWTEICGVIRVRNEVLKEGSSEQKNADATDCEVGRWVPGECSSPCDAKMKGGMQTLTREVITINTKYGHACPALSWQRKCNEFKCPVDCKVTGWSGWSKCSKECGGGVQSRNRHLLVKPKDGGRACDTLQESQPCNSFSCDRDCVLKKWTKLTPCSKACDGGFQEKFRHVKRPVRANGFCPSKSSKRRYNKQKCNTQACVGDEVCIAAMDLVIAIDCSGSLSEKGFAILKNFAKAMITRVKHKAYGKDAVHVSVVQFGNGELDDKTKVVSDAIVVSPLTADMDDAKAKLDGMTWKKGFTNMAQAFLKANQIITRSPRKTAAGAVLLITDGKPSFNFQTDKAVKETKGRARVIIVQVKQFAAKETVEKMREYASKPWQSNYVMIPGKAKLKADYGHWADTTLVSACPRAESPSAVASVAHHMGFKKVFEGLICPQTSDTHVIDAESPSACFADSTGYDDVKGFAFSEPHEGATTGKCLLYTTKCKEDALEANATYDVYEAA
eukprot:gnl/TRDRNA2_/TRDRNA2_175267_c2_seq19.p1 gnl/TRDRNA2_/TRDRNA2_175267_c2~~gnl/TRDRNA2_/TRDRNA2_175267_c2_seq19.p1  ORF type:complete len:994 (-),score=222.84 gnl/TRDRNA2_/TRDRNA2_175267_c2_seq19:134-3115(-)